MPKSNDNLSDCFHRLCGLPDIGGKLPIGPNWCEPICKTLRIQPAAFHLLPHMMQGELIQR